MAADDIFLSRPGSANNDFTPETDASALFLKLFSGEVLDAFDEYNVMYDLIEKRVAPKGSKSAQFLVTGRAAASGLLPDASGNLQNLLSSTFMNRIKSNEKEVFVDGPIIAPTAITEFDELRAQYDVRQGHAIELGRGVAEEFDIRGLLMLANGARSTSLIDTLTPENNDRSGTRVLDADWNSNGASAVATLFRLKRLLDAKFVPQLDRHVIITPECYSNLAQQTDLLNRDWVAGSNGDFADGTVLKVAGFQLHISARLKSADNSTGLGNLSAANRSGCLNIYSGASAPNSANGHPSGAPGAGQFQNVVALAFHKSGVGATELEGMTMESEYKIEFQSTLMLAKKICGISWLRPESCVEITDV